MEELETSQVLCENLRQQLFGYERCDLLAFGGIDNAGQEPLCVPPYLISRFFGVS